MIRTASLAALLSLSACALAAAQSAVTPAPQGTVSADQAMIATIVTDAVNMVKRCDMASTRSQDRNVRSLCRQAARLDAAIAIAGLNVGEAIGATGVSLTPSPQALSQVDLLGQKTGDAFDRSLLLLMIDADEEERGKLRYAIEFTADGPVRRFESSVLGRLSNELDGAETVLSRKRPV